MLIFKDRRIRDLKRAIRYLRRMSPPRSLRARHCFNVLAKEYVSELKEKTVAEKKQ